MRKLQFTSKSTWIGIALLYIFISNLLFIQRTEFSDEWTNLSHDSGMYYAYLPATFIKKDILWKFMATGETDDNEKGIQYWATPTETGGWVPKMTMGKAFMDLPFFFAADAFTTISAKYERNGFSMPYRYGIICSTMFYALFGLLLLRASLLQFFSDKIAAWTLIALTFATNLYLYTTHETGMSHPHNFFLISTAIYLVTHWNKGNLWRNSIFLGLVLGLIVLIRPINILLILPLPFFFTHKFNRKSEIWIDLNTFLSIKHLILICLSGLLVIFPQLLFWKIQSGFWIFYSYGDEHFFFSNPQILNGLFSFRKGWFVYTPIMIFAVFGLFIFAKKHHLLGRIIFIVFGIFLYVTFSWWCWWYGGGFSARTLIDFYPFLAFGLASWISFILSQRILIQRVAGILFLFMIGLNMFQSFQFKNGILHADAMNWTVYKGIFLKDKRFESYYEKLSHPDYENQKSKGFERENFDSLK